jgi:NADPH:quinone reductase-like Zn-dependent oxidoreductase
VDAVFDNIGGETLGRSFRLLARGGILVSYAIASALRGSGSLLVLFLGLVARLVGWQLLPNGRSATFYDIWSGSMLRQAAFRRDLKHDLGAVLELLSRGDIHAHVAARFPLAQVAAAMELAESRTVYGKVVLVP